MKELLQDPMFIYTIAFVIFIALAYRFGRKGAMQWLDGEIQKIRNQLEEAQRLRAEGEATLAECKARQAAAMADAEDMMRNAKEEAARLKTAAEASLKASLARQEQQASERIRLAEAEALAQVRARAIDIAMKMARTTLDKELSGDAAAKLVDQAIADLPKADAKAKAA